MFIVLNCNELAGISDFGEKSAQVVSAIRWQPAAGIAPRTLRIAGASPLAANKPAECQRNSLPRHVAPAKDASALAANNQQSASGIHFRGI
jgi:hypothetical protein